MGCSQAFQDETILIVTSYHFLYSPPQYNYSSTVSGVSRGSHTDSAFLGFHAGKPATIVKKLDFPDVGGAIMGLYRDNTSTATRKQLLTSAPLPLGATLYFR